MLFNFRCLQILLFNKKKKIRKGSVDSDVIMWLRESGSYEKHRILWEFVMLRVIPLSSSWNRKWSKTFYSQLPFQRCCPIPWCPSCCKRYLDCEAFGVFFLWCGVFFMIYMAKYFSPCLVKFAHLWSWGSQVLFGSCVRMVSCGSLALFRHFKTKKEPCCCCGKNQCQCKCHVNLNT